MKRFMLCVRAVACLAAVAASASLRAMTPPPPPDFGSEAPWESHHIMLVRVVGVQSDGKQAKVALRTERVYTDYGGANFGDWSVPLAAISLGWYWRGDGAYSKPVNVSEGDELLVWPDHCRSGSWAPGDLPGRKIEKSAATDGLLDSLDEIAKVRLAGGRSEGLGVDLNELKRISRDRGAGGEKALKAGVSSPRPMVVAYCLSVLPGFHPKDRDPSFAETLRKLREDSSRMSLRSSANRLLPRYAAVADEAKAESLQWTRDVFSQGNVSAVSARDLAKEISEGYSSREERVGFFLSVSHDESKGQDVRCAAMSELTCSRCFDYEHPAGKASSSAFSGILSMLKSNDPVLRICAVEYPRTICLTIRSPSEADARANEARSSVRDALQSERDEKMRKKMEAAWSLSGPFHK